MNHDCPDLDELKQLMLGKLTNPPAAEVEMHLLECRHCQETAASINLSDTFVDGVRTSGQESLAAGNVLDTDDQVRVDRITSDLNGLHHHSGTSVTEYAPIGIPLAQHETTRARDDELLAELAQSWLPAQQSDELGRLGDYRVLRLLGAGGMGGVFLAEDLQLKRHVALKVMRPHVAATPGATARFLREAQAAAAVQHDHVVTIFQVGSDHGIPFIAQEWLAGETLDDRLKRDCPLPVADAISLARQMAAGLSAAHSRGLIHRDIKPTNIWLEAAAGDDVPPRIKLLDFGLARLLVDDANLTQSGVVVGTPTYMAPEQAASEPVDHRTDLFSLGVVLYCMTTGRLPFAGKNSIAVIIAAKTETPAAPNSLNADIPTSLSDLILRLLAKQPAQRPESAAAVARELKTLESAVEAGSRNTIQPQVAAAKQPPRRGLRFTLALSGGAALVVLLGVIVITITNKDGTTTIIETPDTSTVEVTTGEPSRSGLVTRDSRPTWYGWPADAPPAAIVPFDAAQAQRHQEAWAEHLGLPVAYTNNCGMKFVLIPPGEFLRGSTQAEIEEALNSVPDHARWREYVRSESPPHRVIVTQPVYLGVHEVTQALYQMVMGQNPSSFSATGTDQKLVEEVAGLDTTNHPVETVSWNEAVEFCTKLSQQEQLKAFYRRANETVTPLAGTGYRLSTEAEWEFACRAGTTTKYWSGDKDDDLLRAGWCGAKADRRTHPVGELPANPFGLFDVHGNVFEWVQDGWEPAFYDRFQQTPAVDPTGSMSSTWRLLRGGQWGEPLSDCRSSNRYAHVPYHRDCYTGFRVLLSADGVRESLKRID